jgi:hypothetical protein
MIASIPQLTSTVSISSGHKQALQHLRNADLDEAELDQAWAKMEATYSASAPIAGYLPLMPEPKLLPARTATGQAEARSAQVEHFTQMFRSAVESFLNGDLDHAGLLLSTARICMDISTSQPQPRTAQPASSLPIRREQSLRFRSIQEMDAELYEQAQAATARISTLTAELAARRRA